jgi:hypothetical protein
VIDGLIWICSPLEAAFRAEPGLCLIACQGRDGELAVIDILRFDEAGPESDARLCDTVCREFWRQRCPAGRLWACVYSMPAPANTSEEREGFERLLRARHRGKLCGEKCPPKA